MTQRRNGQPNWIWHLTNHAELRAHQMGLSEADVLRALTHPETDYPSDPCRHPPGRRVCTSGPLAVVYVPASGEIVTVLFNRRTGRAA